MPASIIIDDSNYKRLLGDGTSVIAGGDRRLLSALPKPPGYNTGLFSKSFYGAFGNIPRSEWSDRIKEQAAKKMRISDAQYFAPHDQNGLPTCWSNGPAHAMTTMRVMQGLPLVYISACSAAVPISGGHSGGYEGDAIKLFTERGGASFDVWSNNDTSRSLDKDPKTQASREFHKILEVYECESFDDWATAALMGFDGAKAFNWWSHVISGGDLVEIERGSYGFMDRNNWGNWGDKNDLGQPGYVTMREGKGTPSSGFVIRQVTSSPV